MHPKAMNCRVMHIFKGVRVEEFHLKFELRKKS